MKKLRILAIAAIFSVTIYSLFFLSFFSTWHRLERIANHGRTTSGVVVLKEPNNHESVGYEYWVETVKYLGTSPAAMNGLPAFADIRIGDTITVTYWPERPKESFGGNRSDVYATMSFFLFFLLPVACIILGIVAAIGLRYKRVFMWPDVIRLISKAG